MKLIRLIVLALPLFAQTTRYPGAIDSDGSLFVVSDNVQTSLNVAMQTTDTTAVVASSTGFVPNMIATICDTSTSTGKCTAWEHMLVTAVAGNVLTLTRGFAGTSPRAHAAGLNVNILIDSVHQGVLKSSVIAIENALGPNLINIGLSPVVNSASYNFGAYSCNSSSACSPGGPSGMSLIAGNNTLTMNPVPNGVNGSDANHRLNVSGGTGGSEGCLITGGSGQSGQPSGQVIINCANTHSGSWTIQSAAGGIPEAIAAAAAAGGTVVIPSGTIPVTAAIQVPANITLAGNGQSATVLRVANGALAANANWQLSGGPGGTYCIVCLVSGGSFQRVKDLTIDANGQNQAWIYYGDITGNNVSNVIIDRVTVKNHPIAGGTGVTMQFLGHTPLSANANNVIMNASTIGIAGCTVPNGGGAFYIEGEGNRVTSSYAINICDSAYVISNCDHCLIADSVADVGSGQMSTPTYSIEGATDSTYRNDQCIGTGANPHRYCVGIASTPAMQSVGNMVLGVSSSHSSTALEIGATNSAFGATTPIVDTQVISLRSDNPALDCIVLSQYVNKLQIIGGSLVGCGGSGISITSTGALGATVVQNAVINGLTVDHAANYGILAVNSTSGPPVNAITIVNSFLGDTFATPTQTRGIWFQPGLVSNAYIVGNTLSGNTGAPALFQNTFDVFSVVTNNPGAGTLGFLASTLGSASTAGGGAQRFCGDCTLAAVCVTGGTGHMAVSNGTNWTCQ